MVDGGRPVRREDPETRMTPVLLVANAAPSISIELGAAVAWLLGVIVILLGVIAWFLRREITNNDTAHKELRSDFKRVEADVKRVDSDVKKLLAGDVPWVVTLNTRVDKLYERMDKVYERVDKVYERVDKLYELVLGRARNEGR